MTSTRPASAAPESIRWLGEIVAASALRAPRLPDIRDTEPAPPPETCLRIVAGMKGGWG